MPRQCALDRIWVHAQLLTNGAALPMLGVVQPSDFRDRFDRECHKQHPSTCS